MVINVATNDLPLRCCRFVGDEPRFHGFHAGSGKIIREEARE